jgi:uncharacterized protein YndB with AHSA1/START domain
MRGAGRSGLTLAASRVVPGAPPAVFGLFTDPVELARWWGPQGFTIPSLVFDARVGAGYRIEMQPPEGEAFYLAGEFRAVDPPNRLSFTFRWEDPDPDDVETVADLFFLERDGMTEVSLTQGPFKTEERLALHRGGWGDSFDKLEALLTGASR